MKPTENQKQAFKKVVERIRAGEKINIGEVMKEVGYAEATAHNPQKNLTSKSGWQKLLAKIEDEKILEKFYDIALDVTDKRACLEAGKEIFKLKDRYPAGKLKLGAFEERDEITEEIDESNISGENTTKD